MERALIIGASGGIGAALAKAKVEGGAEVVGLSRSKDGLDITNESQIVEALSGLEGVFDSIVCATGRLDGAGQAPEKSLKTLSAKAMVDQFAINAIGPALVIKHALGLLPRDRKGLLAVLSAKVGSISDNQLGGWYSYRAAKAALNQTIKGASIEIARSHKHACLVAVHPGTVATEFTKSYNPKHGKITPEEFARDFWQTADALSQSQTGSFIDRHGNSLPW